MDKKVKLLNIAASFVRSIFFFGVFLFVPSFITIIVSAVAKALDLSEDVISGLATPTMIISYSVIILALSLFFLLLKSNVFKVTGVRVTKGRYLIDGALLGLGLGGVFQGAVMLLSKILPPELIESQNAHSSSILSGGIVLAVIYTVFVAPVCEELVFRGLILGSLGVSMKKPIAVVISALLFSVVHLPSLIALGYTLLLGLVLGFVYLRTKSLIPCILLHVAFNASNYLLFIPKNVGLYILLIISIPLTIYSVIDIFIRGRK